MFASVRQSLARRAFSTTAARNDLAKVTLIGRLGQAPSIRTNRNGKEYVAYAVCTNSLNADGSTKPTWHNIASYGHENTRNYLSNLPKGSLVYVECQYDIREPEAGADPTTPQGQRQHFLRHEFLRVLKRGQAMEAENDSALV